MLRSRDTFMFEQQDQAKNIFKKNMPAFREEKPSLLRCSRKKRRVDELRADRCRRPRTARKRPFVKPMNCASVAISIPSRGSGETPEEIFPRVLCNQFARIKVDERRAAALRSIHHVFGAAGAVARDAVPERDQRQVITR
jgi:hypothetical protein